MQFTLLDVFMVALLTAMLTFAFAANSLGAICLCGHVAVIYTAVGTFRSGAIVRCCSGWKRICGFFVFAVCVICAEMVFLGLQFLPSVTM